MLYAMTKEDAQTENVIIQAAIKLFAEKGLSGTTTRELAQASGTNLSLISYYFGGKEGLYLRVVEDFAKKIQASIEQLFQNKSKEEFTAENFRLNLHKLIDKLLEQRMNHRELFVILERERIDGFPHSKKIFEKTFKNLHQEFYEWILLGQKAKVLNPKVDAGLFLVLLKESIFGVVISEEAKMDIGFSCPKIQKDKEKVLNMITLIFTQGILK